ECYIGQRGQSRDKIPVARLAGGVPEKRKAEPRGGWIFWGMPGQLNELVQSLGDRDPADDTDLQDRWNLLFPPQVPVGKPVGVDDANGGQWQPVFDEPGNADQLQIGQRMGGPPGGFRILI